MIRNLWRRKKVVMGISLWIVVCLLGGVLLIKFYQHEKRMENEMRDLLGRTQYVEDRMNQMQNYYNFQPNYQDDSYNYLAIGNSLTLITNWGRGICATQPDGDYAGRLKQYLEGEHGSVVMYRYNFSTWECLTNRIPRMDLLDTLLSDKLDLVTIQLGENVSDTTTYERDLGVLIDYIRQRAPKARIIMIGDFWDKDRNEMRRAAAQSRGIPFADLSAIIGDKDYQSKEGTEALLEDGSMLTVNKAEETHPGDKGMEYIANQVIQCIGQP